MLVVVQAYLRAGGEWLFRKPSGGRLLTRSSKFSSDHLIVVQAWSVELVAVVAELVTVLVLLGLSRLGLNLMGLAVIMCCSVFVGC